MKFPGINALRLLMGQAYSSWWCSCRLRLLTVSYLRWWAPRKWVVYVFLSSSCWVAGKKGWGLEKEQTMEWFGLADRRFFCWAHGWGKGCSCIDKTFQKVVSRGLLSCPHAERKFIFSEIYFVFFWWSGTVVNVCGLLWHIPRMFRTIAKYVLCLWLFCSQLSYCD